jgi:hypothetical protein
MRRWLALTTLVLALAKGLVDMSSYFESFKAIRAQLERVDVLAPAIRVLGQTPQWVLGLAIIYLVAYLAFGGEKREAGLVELRYAGHGSKQLFAKDTGVPVFFIYQPWFINTSQQSAEAVAAKADFWGTYSTVVRGVFCAWAIAPERDAPHETTFTAVKSNVDIPPNQIPVKLNLAARLPDEVIARAFTRESLNAPTGLKQPAFSLDQGLLLVRVRLVGKCADQTFWLMLINDAAEPTVRAPLWRITGWAYRPLFYVMRKRALRRAHAAPPTDSAKTTA